MTIVSRGEIVELLNVFNEQYQWQEKHDPREGYLVQIQEAIEMRKQYPESQTRPIELHCGSAAGQTVFHIHVRTNVYMK